MATAFQYGAFQENAYQIDSITVTVCPYWYWQEGYAESGYVCQPYWVWPDPSQVQSGVAYGPNGNDYTGTMTGGTGSVWMRAR